MSKMRFIAMGVAGAAALGAAFLANGFLNKPVKKEIVEVSKVSMTPVLVALQEIRMGDVLNASNVGWKDWPSDQVRQFMIDKPGNEDFFQKLEGEVISLGGPLQSLETRLKRWFEARAIELFTADTVAYCAGAGLSAKLLGELLERAVGQVVPHRGEALAEEGVPERLGEELHQGSSDPGPASRVESRCAWGTPSCSWCECS